MNLNVNKIKLVLAEKGMLLQELAAQSGISRQSVSTVMARGTCSIVTAGKLAKGLGLSVTEIVRED